jgi:amino acid transporter
MPFHTQWQEPSGPTWDIIQSPSSPERSKKRTKKLAKVVLFGAFIIMLIYLGASSFSAMSTLGVAETTVGGNEWGFFQAYSWLSYGDVPAGAIEAAGITNFQSAWSTGIAAIIARGMDLGWLSWIIAFAGVIWLANDIPPFLLVASRTMFAMSFDKMMPEKLAEVSERWHAPTWALIVTGAFGIIGCVAEAYAGTDLGTYFNFAGMVATDIGDAFFLTLFCVSCMLLPLERKDIYDRAAIKHSIGTVVGLGLVATLGAGYCLMTFVKESTGWMFSPTSTGDWSSFIGFWGLWVVGGILLYVYYMYRNTTKGVDMRTLYLSIPPE